MLRNIPIQRKLMVMMLLISGTVLLFTCVAFIVYEYQAFRQSLARNVESLGQVIAANSTAALAFDNREDAGETLSALRADQHIVAAALYTADGVLFATYPANVASAELPSSLGSDGSHFDTASFIDLAPVKQGNNRRLGTLYIKSDLRALYQRIFLYSLIAAGMTAVSFLVAYVMSRLLQTQISGPVLALASAAKAVADRRDYSVRAHRQGADEFGLLTDAFNQMLTQIEQQDRDVSESRELLHAIIDTAVEGIITIDELGDIESFNAAAIQIFGYQREEVLGQNVKVLMPMGYAAHNDAYLSNFLRTGEKKMSGSGREVAGLRKNGTSFPMDLAVVEVRLSGKRKFSCFVRDITERKQAEGKLKAQLSQLDLLQRITRAIGERQTLQSIFQVVLRSLEDNLPIDFGCICLYDSEAQVLTVASVGVHSAALAPQIDMVEQSRVPIDANGLSRCTTGELVYEPDAGAIPSPFPQRIAAGGLHSLVAAPLLAESKVFGVLIATRHAADSFSSSDCEFLRQLSEHVALAAHNAQLYNALQETYNDLRQSQQTILQQERLRALGQMASGVAHDINNAISPVALYTESLLEREPGLSERARSYLVTIQRAIEDVAQTVSRMREFYRPREPQLSLARIDLNNIVKQVIELTRVRWRDLPQERGVMIELNTDFAERLPQIMGAEHEIRDALTNLIFNAVDAMPQGGTLTLRTCPVIRPRTGDFSAYEEVWLEVTDTGIGMSEDIRTRCLEPFFTTKGERGTGLGLAMVYGMVQRHSAELQIDSALGKGTTVRLVFSSALVTAEVSEPRLTTRSPLQPLSLLIVDDDPLIIDSLRDILQHDGHQVITANGGQQGIDTFVTARAGGIEFDAVITDLGMPYVDGRRVAAAVKHDSPNTPVILLTGWGQRLMADNEVPLHVDRVLNKPPKLEHLRRALADLIPSALVSL
jgi:PAS domain S-box-containing protein